MKKCIVIGGGLAGLSTAVYLSKQNISVNLLESSPKLGGRAYSFLAKDGKTLIDNGQHIMMGCYSETLNFMRLIGAADNLKYQSHLEISFLKEGFKKIKLKAARLPYPFNLLIGLLNYKAVSLNDRIKILKFFLKIKTYSEKELSRMTIEEWLNKEKQGNNISKALWEIITVGALNTSVRKASAKIFADVIKEIFFKGDFSSTIIIPKYGLSETFCEPAARFLQNNNSEISLSHLVTGLKIEDREVVEVQTDQTNFSDFSFVVSTIPFYALEKIISPDYLNKKPEFRYTSILSVHLWLSDNKLQGDFYGLLGSPLHWIFNKGTHITIVISDADYLMKKSKEEIFDIIKSELNKYTDIETDEIIDFQLIKEKRATFIPSENILDCRPSVVTGLDNFFVAGDWVDTGLPSTIESAVKSGRMVSEALLNSKKCKFTFYKGRRNNYAGKG